MGMMKKEFTDHEIGLEQVRAGLDWLCMYGKKSFKDYTGEWVEVRCSRMANFFDNEFEVYPHLTMETV